MGELVLEVRHRTYPALARLFNQAMWRGAAPLSNMEAPMRIISFLLTAAGVAAMGEAALAQSGTMSTGHRGSHSASAGWSRGPALGRHHDFRRGMAKGPGSDHGRPHGRFGRGGERFDLPFGGIGFIDEFEAVDPHGNGFFAGGGGEVRLQGGRPYYDYDRSYPYEWASAAAAGSARWYIDEDEFDEAPQCGVEHGVRVCRGRR
jgi:hypothetical protein